MRILYLAADWGLSLSMTGGAGTHMRGTIKGFRAHAHEVLPIIGGDILFRSSRLNPHSYKGLSVYRWIKNLIPKQIRLLLRDVRYYYRGWELQKKAWPEIVNFKLDAIYERSAYMDTLGLRLSKKLNIPLFEESDGHMVEAFNTLYGVFSPKLANWIERRKLSASKRIVVMAEAAIKHTANKHSQPVDKFVIKSLAVDRDAFVPDPQLTKKLRKEFMLDGHFVVGFIAGQLQKYHGLSLLLDAAKKIRELRSNVMFIVIAGGSLTEMYLKRVYEEHLSNMLFIGLIDKDQIASYMQLFDIGVVPDCVPHMFPIKFVEYGVMGICPLVPDYPAFNSLFNFSEKKDVIFRAGDPDSLASAILALANRPEHTKSIGEKWRHEVLEQYKWEKTVVPVLNAMEREVHNNG